MKTKIFSERLKLLMRKNSVTQVTLAENVGVTKQSISLYVNAHRVPDIEVFKKMCEFFNVSADYFLGLKTDNAKTVENLTNRIEELEDMIYSIRMIIG